MCGRLRIHQNKKYNYLHTYTSYPSQPRRFTWGEKIVTLRLITSIEGVHAVRCTCENTRPNILTLESLLLKGGVEETTRGYKRPFFYRNYNSFYIPRLKKALYNSLLSCTTLVRIPAHFKTSWAPSSTPPVYVTSDFESSLKRTPEQFFSSDPPQFIRQK